MPRCGDRALTGLKSFGEQVENTMPLWRMFLGKQVGRIRGVAATARAGTEAARTGKDRRRPRFFDGLVRRCVQYALRAADAPPIRVVLWNGLEIAPDGGATVATITVRDPLTLVRLLLRPSRHFGDAYIDERMEVSGNLTRFLTTIYRRMLARARPCRRPLLRAWPATKAISRTDARRNAHEHYDLGNDFYRLWLDERLIYTCAYFARSEMTLEEAQVAKLDYICRKLRLRPGQTVVEAGCGWGGAGDAYGPPLWGDRHRLQYFIRAIRRSATSGRHPRPAKSDRIHRRRLAHD